MNQPAMLDVVALLADLPSASLERGDVGTIVEALDATTWLVEFADRDGQMYALQPVATDQLIPLHFDRRPASA
jgi:hypothetical protein